MKNFNLNMGHSTFFSNAEAYALEILQQKLMKDAQRSAQQSFMELAALKSLFNQGQFIYCIPFGGMGFPPCPNPLSYYNFSSCNFPCSESYLNLPPCHLPSLPSSTCETSSSSSNSPSSGISCSNPSPNVPPSPPHSVVHINVKNGQPRHSNKPGSDECNLGKDGVEIVIDLKDYLPAEIFLNAEERIVDVKACHTNSQGSKTFSRRYELPACILLDSVKCFLSHDGFLMFSASWCKME